MEKTQATSQVANGILCSNAACYQVMDWIGKGAFGTVAKCLNVATGNLVAVKIPKKGNEDILKDEIAILKVVQALDPDKKNIVKFIEYFRFQELSCLVFEMLDKSLWDLMNERNWAPLSLNEIRTITQQVLVAFDALKGLGILYCDLKFDNIMLINHSKQPLKIKLIDFGLALPESKVKLGMIMQHLTYRAPEVTLGLPLTTAIDMWSLGCNLAHMYFGSPLFPNNCEYNWMKIYNQGPLLSLHTDIIYNLTVPLRRIQSGHSPGTQMMVKKDPGTNSQVQTAPLVMNPNITLPCPISWYKNNSTMTQGQILMELNGRPLVKEYVTSSAEGGKYFVTL
ncbi:hypothetical protein Q5P01_010480 [Channa striata]|uniref:Protein kinase domain-containing protein n=1 Tax=Channa striata TaxID=64152 RepID=A0AA88SVL5_CHASR|nr:hypothetical protein Q5P01_010480 [Channa striata]